MSKETRQEAPPTHPGIERRSLLKSVLAIGAGAAALGAGASSASAAEQCKAGESTAEKQLHRRAKHEKQIKAGENKHKQAYKKNPDDKASEENTKASNHLLKVSEQHQKRNTLLANRSNLRLERAKKMQHRRFGVGRSMMWIDLPNGESLEAMTSLESIQGDPDGDGVCDLTIDIEFDGIGQEKGTASKALEILASQLKSTDDDGLGTVWIQFGHSAEYAYEGLLQTVDAAATAAPHTGAGGVVSVTVRATFSPAD